VSDESHVSLMAAHKDAVLLSLLEKLANHGSWEAQLFMAEQCCEDEGQRDKWRSAAWETMTETTTGSDSAEGSLVGEKYPSLSASFLSSLVKAAEDDDHTAQLMLGRAYRTGVGKIVGKDTVKSFKYLQAAKAAGVEEAKVEMKKMLHDFFEESEKARQAKEWEKCYLGLKSAQEGGVNRALSWLDVIFCKFSRNLSLSLRLPRNMVSLSLNPTDNIHSNLFLLPHG
jgi:TPR repeat protein